MAATQGTRVARELEQFLLRPSGEPDAPGGRMPGDYNRTPEREGVFRYDGLETWEIGLGAEVGRYRNAFGLHQIQHLLHHPGEWISTTDLLKVCGQEVVLDSSASMEVADTTALAQCTEEAKVLAEQLKSAREGGDAERAEKLEEEMEALARYLGSGRSHRGTPRRLGDRANQFRDRVGHSVRDSFRKILGRNPELAEHLQASIKLRRQCGYFPASHVHWTF